MSTASNIFTRVPPLFVDLAKIIAGEINCSQDVLLSHSNDGSPYVISPQAIIYPKNATDIKHVLAFAREYTMPVTVCGSGESRSGGSLGEGVILDMRRYFNKIRTVNMIENTVTVDAGTTVGELLEKLHNWHFDIPLFLGIDKNATVGAVIATKSSSAGSFFHGTIRDWIESVTVVVDNGEEHKIADGITPSGRLLGIYQDVFPFITRESPLLRASKPISYDDGSGYNLWNTSIGPRQLIDQLAGSEGTLAIITSITFRISSHKPHILTTCIPVTRKELLPTYVEIAKHHRGEHIFMYDKNFMELSERYYPSVVPFFPEVPYVLLVTHTGQDKEKLHQIVHTFTNALPVEKDFLKTIDSRKMLERIIDSEFLLSLFSMYTQDTLFPVSVGNGMIVTTHQIPTFLKDLQKYLDSLGKLYTLTGNIGSGHIGVVTLFDTKTKNYEEDLFLYTQKLFSIIKDYDGGISATGGEGLSRTPFLGYIYTEPTLALFKKIKELWDPLMMLNPGKKTGVTAEYLRQHLTRTPFSKK